MTQGPTTLILTRPLAQSRDFAARFTARFPDVPVIVAPLMRIEAGVPADPEGAAGIILTSVHAVAAAQGWQVPAYCVGPRTTQAARAAGLNARDCGGDAEALIATILADRPAGPLVHLHGEHTRGDVAGRLTAGGIACHDRVVYRQIAQDFDENARLALAGPGRILLPLFSPRSAALAGQACAGAHAEIALAAISAATRHAWTGPAPVAEALAVRPDAEAMLEALAGLIDAPRHLEGGAAQD
ncbi:uroporphyrinogen-III synthase [Actibacterium sp.]|uniref:uroporphyrinogen-III synthase n=1 Tax=Actibacterium sp. TaxID=1872125 RepID=UPI00356A65B4